MLEIPLTKGFVTIVDDDDAEMVLTRKWYASVCGSYIYAATNQPRGSKPRTLHLHRLLVPGAPFVDHIDGNTLNNTKSNLRAATRAQNYWNRHKRKSRSGFLGVHWFERDGLWEAKIMINKSRIFLGRFADPVEAARAVDKASVELRGEFANLNFPDEYYAQNS